MDPGTLNVVYDHRRGEPRQRHATSDCEAAAPAGRCIDCTLCVQACPTGIDIRNGLQAACIGCGLCIDACHEVMDKIGAPSGLIRLPSLAELAQTPGQTVRQVGRLLRPRVMVYGLLLASAGVAFAISFVQRPDLRLNVIRDRAVMTRVLERGEVEMCTVCAS